MKNLAVVTIICIALLIIPVKTPFEIQTYIIPTRTDALAEETLESPERIYGIDKSREIFNSISRRSFATFVKELTENGSRWIQAPELASSQNNDAREWIIEELTEVSNERIEVEVIGDYKSVLGRLPGYLPVKAPVILVGGHYDSITVSPGANDDGTGIAMMLEIARVMSQYSWPLDIYFGAWNAEELGLYGSKEVAMEFVQRDIDILVYYNVDMLLVPDPNNPTVLVAYRAGQYHVGHYWADLVSMMSMNYGQDIIVPINSDDFPVWESSDHYSFIENGYGASLFVHESGGAYDRWFHTSGDSWDNQDYDYDIASQAVKAIGSSIAFTMSRTYGEPITSGKNFDLLPGNNRNFSFVISGPTMLNVTARWYGGGATFALYGPNGNLIEKHVFDNAYPWTSKLIFEISVSNEGRYYLNILNHGRTTTGHELFWQYDTDIEGNDIPDSQEFWIDNEYFQIDTDLDSISDGEEMLLGTSLDSADSDSDLLPDGYEIENNLNPLDPSDAILDYDGDSLTNLQEYQFGSNPNLVDSDSDQLPDSWEYIYGLNPLVDDSQEDPDNDNLTNIEEYLRGTDPNIADGIPQVLTLTPGIVIGVAAILIVGMTSWYRKR